LRACTQHPEGARDEPAAPDSRTDRVGRFARTEDTVEIERLHRQLQFVVEIDKLKSVFRQSYLMNAERYEDSAEHSWHVAVMAMVLAEHVQEDVDVCHVMKMLLVHDIIEIDAGDTYCYDEQAALDKSDREHQGADRIFSLLPPDQAIELRALWDEFESQVTVEAKFALSLDRLMPLLHNYYTEGRSWKEHGVTRGRVLAHNACIRDGSDTLWWFIKSIIDDAVAKGYLMP
jgi:putative hydrolase of HD superfamily